MVDQRSRSRSDRCMYCSNSNSCRKGGEIQIRIQIQMQQAGLWTASPLPACLPEKYGGASACCLF